MAVYKKVVRISAAELEMLNGMMEHVTPITIENMRLIEDACTVSWAYQKATEQHGYLDRFITAKFGNGMIADVWFYIGLGDTTGTYGGIQFGDEYNIFMCCGEHFDTCYECDDDCKHDAVDGTYAVIYNDDKYIVVIEPE